MVFRHGRANPADAHDNDQDEGPFSTGNEAWNELFATFKMCTKNVFTDADENQLVALLGAHQIGRAIQKFSGFHGRWRPCNNRNTMTNGLFQQITLLGKPNRRWVQSMANEQNGGRDDLDRNNYQWTLDNRNGKGRILINSDIAPYHELDGLTIADDGKID